MVRLEHEVLQSVLKPARYTGGEWNAVIKDHAAVDCTWALALPDVYEVGMSNLGLAILYEVLNRREDIAAERVYAPWTDMEEEMRKRKMPLFSLETKTEISAFDFVGFSLQYEMIYTNVLNMLDLADIPLFAKDRGEAMPFVVGGGPCVYNVEPIADFFDFFIVGEGEEAIVEVSDAFMAWKREGRPGGRKGFLQRLLDVPGIYVPSFYEPEYDEEGNYRALRPLVEAAKPVIYKRVIRDMDDAISVEHPVVPYMDIVHNRIMLELFRGCSRGCRFCQAGICYRPARERTEENLRKMARGLVDATGYDEMSLTSLSSADYSCLGRLVDDLMADFRDEKVSFSLPSLRIDSFSIDLAHKMQQVRKSGLTFAPEAGTQRLRDVINKQVTEDDLFGAVDAAFGAGWRRCKLYFMIGLPTETDDDIKGIASLVQRAYDRAKKAVPVEQRGNIRMSVSCALFVPKAQTPFQWDGQIAPEEALRRVSLLRRSVKYRAIDVHWHDPSTSFVEAVMSRGGRAAAAWVESAWRHGARFDAWTEHFNEQAWRDAAEEVGLDPAAVAQTSYDTGYVMPWEHISTGVSTRFLAHERKKAAAEKTTPDCTFERCAACGACPGLGIDNQLAQPRVAGGSNARPQQAGEEGAAAAVAAGQAASGQPAAGPQTAEEGE